MIRKIENIVVTLNIIITKKIAQLNSFFFTVVVDNSHETFTSTLGLWLSVPARKPSFPPRPTVSGLCVHDTPTAQTVYHAFDKFNFRGEMKNEFNH